MVNAICRPGAATSSNALRPLERPVVLVGTGVRLAGAEDIFQRVTQKLGVPVAPAWTAIDLVPTDDPLFCGRTGTIGDRAGNFAVQNADLVLVLGSRLNIRQVSYNWRSFAREAFVIQVDVDKWELIKPTVRPDLGIECDARRLPRPNWTGSSTRRTMIGARHEGWISWCKARVARYPVVEARHRVVNGSLVNPYHFVEQLFERLGANDIVVCGNATASVVTFQVAKVLRGMRIFANSGCAAMGFDLPAAVGAATGAAGRRVICLAGDGSIQLNVQELQTVVHHQLPIKIFVLNNAGLPVDANEPGRVLRPVRRRRSAQRVVVSLDGGARRPPMGSRRPPRRASASRPRSRRRSIRTGPSCAK